MLTRRSKGGMPASGCLTANNCQKAQGPTMSFMVMSSSLLPAPVSISTEGRMHTGGTGTCVMIRFSGRLPRSRSSQSSSLTALKRLRTRKGFKSSAICSAMGCQLARRLNSHRHGVPVQVGEVCAPYSKPSLNNCFRIQAQKQAQEL